MSTYNVSIKCGLVTIKKSKSKLEDLASVPLSIFKDRSLSVLETLVFYLKNRGLSLKEISTLINRDQRTIWTVFNRAKKKKGKL